jgi:hypothetical protein
MLLSSLMSNAGHPGIASVSEVPFNLAVTGGPPVIGFPAVDGVLAVASIPAHPGVPILAGGFTCDILQYKTIDYRTMAIILLFFLLSDYRNIEYRIGEFKKLSNYRISDLGFNISDYRISDSEKTIGCPPLPHRYPYIGTIQVPASKFFSSRYRCIEAQWGEAWFIRVQCS